LPDAGQFEVVDVSARILKAKLDAFADALQKVSKVLA
jgi:hypothetical protein